MRKPIQIGLLNVGLPEMTLCQKDSENGCHKWSVHRPTAQFKWLYGENVTYEKCKLACYIYAEQEWESGEKL